VNTTYETREIRDIIEGKEKCKRKRKKRRKNYNL